MYFYIKLDDPEPEEEKRDRGQKGRRRSRRARRTEAPGVENDAHDDKKDEIVKETLKPGRKISKENNSQLK